MSKNLIVNLVLLISLLSFAATAFAQTPAFVYQGKLNDGASAANGTYQFQFKLFDTVSGGNQVGQTIADLPATVTNGIFAVNLDFGVASFDGAARFLEISVRLNGGGQSYTTLNPRQPVNSTPYAIRSLNAGQANTANNTLNLGGVPAAQFVQTSDTRLSDDRDPTPGSANYIQNTTVQQASANFNISGEGKANVFNAATFYKIAGTRVFHLNGTDNTFVGSLAGNAIASGGNYNSFFGSEAGKLNSGGFNNTFVGAYSGRANVGGANNAFFGANAGSSNVGGAANSFFGSNAGFTNLSGADNSFFGNSAGFNNAGGNFNSFFGRSAGASVTNALNNSFFGAYSGENTTTGGNSYFGAFAGQKNTTGFANSFFGLNSGKENSGGSNNTYFGANTGQTAGASGSNNTFIGSGAGQTNNVGSNNTVVGYNAKISGSVTNATVIGANAVAGQSNSLVLGTSATKTFVEGGLQVTNQATFNDAVSVNDSLTANSLNVGGGKLAVPTGNGGVTMNTSLTITGGNISAGGATFGSTQVYTLAFNALGGGAYDNLCYNETDDLNPLSVKNLARCSSSRRYKENIEDYKPGIALIKNLRPVTFDWKSSKKHDVGFVAEEVAEVEPLLATYNADRQIEGVKYAQITTALVNAVKEQQTEIEKQSEQIKRQQAQIEALKSLICSQNPNTAVCRK